MPDQNLRQNILRERLMKSLAATFDIQKFTPYHMDMAMRGDADIRRDFRDFQFLEQWYARHLGVNKTQVRAYMEIVGLEELGGFRVPFITRPFDDPVITNNGNSSNTCCSYCDDVDDTENSNIDNENGISSYDQMVADELEPNISTECISPSDLWSPEGEQEMATSPLSFDSFSQTRNDIVNKAQHNDEIMSDVMLSDGCDLDRNCDDALGVRTPATATDQYAALATTYGRDGFYIDEEGDLDMGINAGYDSDIDDYNYDYELMEPLTRVSSHSDDYLSSSVTDTLIAAADENDEDEDMTDSFISWPPSPPTINTTTTTTNNNSSNNYPQPSPSSISPNLRLLLSAIHGNPSTTRASISAPPLPEHEMMQIAGSWTNFLALQHQYNPYPHSHSQHPPSQEEREEAQFLDSWDAIHNQRYWQTEVLFLCQLIEARFKNDFEAARFVFWAEVRGELKRKENQKARAELKQQERRNKINSGGGGGGGKKRGLNANARGARVKTSSPLRWWLCVGGRGGYE